MDCKELGHLVGPGATVGEGMSPAKFTFDINAAPSCANDYIFSYQPNRNTSLNIVVLTIFMRMRVELQHWALGLVCLSHPDQHRYLGTLTSLRCL